MPTDAGSKRTISLIKGRSTSSIKQILENARRVNDSEVVAGCETELRLRGSLIMTSETAQKMLAATSLTEGRPLVDVIEIAFTDVPASHDEVSIIRWVANNPGTTYTQFLKAYGKKDLSLAIGHLIYDRLGYFRPFLESRIQSDLLLTRTPSPPSVSYTLRPEASEAFSRLKII